MRLLISTVAVGSILNVGGWLANVFILGGMWRRAHLLAPAHLPSPFSSSIHAVVPFVSDFVFAFVLCCIYRLASPGWRGLPIVLAFACSALVWLCGVPMTYLALVNGGFLPPSVSIATTGLALLLFLLAAPLLPTLLRDPDRKT
jgi:hypothetical protein